MLESLTPLAWAAWRVNAQATVAWTADSDAGAQRSGAEAGEAEGEIDPMIERFDAQRSAARRHVQGRIEALARVAIEPRIPGRRYRNVHVACLLERQTTDRIALPAWILAYRHRGDVYRAIVHGQRAEVVFGRSPVDRGKVGWLAAVVAAVAAIVALILAAR